MSLSHLDTDLINHLLWREMHFQVSYVLEEIMMLNLNSNDVDFQ